jgi:hypothetical protein
MNRRTVIAASGVLALLGVAPAPPSVLARAAGTQAGQAPQARPSVPLKVDVVFSRFQGDKRLASLPYTMWVNAVDQRFTGQQMTTLRMGVDVPVGTVSQTRGPGTSTNNPVTTTTTGPDFRHVGTSIDCWAYLAEDGRYTVGVRLTDSSIFTGDPQNQTAMRLADPMAFRSFSTSNSITMRDGQTTQFAAATDKVTGEIVKVDVTINSVK